MYGHRGLILFFVGQNDRNGLRKCTTGPFYGLPKRLQKQRCTRHVCSRPTRVHSRVCTSILCRPSPSDSRPAGKPYAQYSKHPRTPDLQPYGLTVLTYGRHAAQINPDFTPNDVFKSRSPTINSSGSVNSATAGRLGRP